MTNDPNEVIVSKDVLIEEMQLILNYLLEQTKSGKRIRLSDARSRLTGVLTLDFADYFKFLKRYNYVVINRSDHGLAVTDEGKAITTDAPPDEFLSELKQHFGGQVEDTQELIEMHDDSFTSLREEPEAQEPEPLRPARVINEPPRESPGHSSSRGVKFDSKYTRYESIGSGGIGTVYRGRLNSLSVDVAIKEIKELFSYFNFLQRSEVIKNLRSAVGRMAMLQHPLVVRVLDQNTDVAHPYFVTEYLPGGNFRDLMESKTLDLDRSLILFSQICYALKAAHENELVHGSLKPENILLDSQGNIRVTDFGITSLLNSDSAQGVPRVVTGSIGYLPPEQMADSTSVSVASDIYSLGIMLYEILTGHMPARRSPLPSETNHEIPKAIDEMFDRMTRDNPEDRYTDMDALLDDFYSALKDNRYLGKGRMVLFAGLDEKEEQGQGIDAKEKEQDKDDKEKKEKKSSKK